VEAILNEFEGWAAGAESHEEEPVQMSGCPNESRMLITNDNMISLRLLSAFLSLFLSSWGSFGLSLEEKWRVERVWTLEVDKDRGSGVWRTTTSRYLG
jgi:hypothetical protein